MNTAGLLAHLESAVTNQVMLAGSDPAVDGAAQAILAVLEPALQRAALDLAEQAAAEIEAQLADQHIEVVVADGEPSLQVVSSDVRKWIRSTRSPADQPAADETGLG